MQLHVVIDASFLLPSLLEQLITHYNLRSTNVVDSVPIPKCNLERFEERERQRKINEDPKKRTENQRGKATGTQNNGSSTMATSSRSLSSPTTDLPTRGNGKEASITGFVLKLNNMVNGAPDDIVSVSG